MISTYSEKEKAIRAIDKFCQKKEQDIFVYHVKCPCSEEWSLRTRDQIISEDSPRIVYKYYLPFGHTFRNVHNATREANVWSERLKIPITIDRKTKIVNQYPNMSGDNFEKIIISYYKLDSVKYNKKLSSDYIRKKIKSCST